MTTPSDEERPEYIHRVSDDGAGGLEDTAGIADNIAATFTDLGTIYTDTGDIPSSASIRAAGAFTDAYAARQYLEGGGLSATDNDGNVVPIGFVYFFQYFDEVLEEDVYEVYIDDDT